MSLCLDCFLFRFSAPLSCFLWPSSFFNWPNKRFYLVCTVCSDFNTDCRHFIENKTAHEHTLQMINYDGRSTENIFGITIISNRAKQRAQVWYADAYLWGSVTAHTWAGRMSTRRKRNRRISLALMAAVRPWALDQQLSCLSCCVGWLSFDLRLEEQGALASRTLTWFYWFQQSVRVAVCFHWSQILAVMITN